jgi:hypothetical protein
LDDETEGELDDTLSRLHISNLGVIAPTDDEARIMRDDVQGDDEECDADLCAMFNSVLIPANVELDRRAYNASHPNNFTPDILPNPSHNPIVDFALRPSPAAHMNAAVARYANSLDLQPPAQLNILGGALPGGLADPQQTHLADPQSAHRADPSENPVAVADQIEFSDREEEEVELINSVPPFIGPSPATKASERFILLPQLQQVHSDTAGHVGSLKMYRRMRMLQEAEWGLSAAQINSEISRFIAACPVCQKAATMPSAWTSGRWIRQPPFKEVAIDVLEMPTADSDGNVKVFVVVDSFSRAIELFPLPSADAERVAECLYAVYCRYFRMSTVRIDNAKAFLSSVVSQLLRLLGSRPHPITPFAHWQNGQVERSHREIMRHLRHLLIGDVGGANSSRRWNTLLHGSRRICMNTINASTGVTPNELVFGGFADSDEALFQEPSLKPSTSERPEAFVAELQREQLDLLTRAEDYQQKKFDYIIANTDDVGDQDLRTGDWVLCYRGGLPHGRPRTKLQMPWSGPWRVLDRDVDAGHPRVRCIHAASHKVETFGRGELRAFNTELMDGPDDFAKAGQRDEWDYNVDCIVGHRPEGSRRLPSGGLRRKDAYQFNVKYKFLPISDEPGCENPCWQPYNNVRFTEALFHYCRLPAVSSQLGADFCPATPGIE